MAEDPKQPAELYSIVVVGAMNPRIHHPVWYQMIGLLAPEDVNRTVREQGDRSVALLPDGSRFFSPRFQVQCLQDRWEIQTSDAANRDEILVVASSVFAKLSETTIDRYGFNTVLHRRTACPNVRERLADMVIGLRLGFSDGGARSSILLYTNRFDDHGHTVQVEPSPFGPDYVAVGHNSNHETGPSAIKLDATFHFEIGPLMAAAYDADYRLALAATDGVVAGLTPGH